MEESYFDIESLIELIKEQEPDRVDLIEQLRQCEHKRLTPQPYIYFVSGERPNLPNSEWQFKECVALEHDTEGTIVLDILKDGRIGGIEFVKQIPNY